MKTLSGVIFVSVIKEEYDGTLRYRYLYTRVNDNTVYIFDFNIFGFEGHRY